MALAGCTGVFVGFESLDDRNVAGRPEYAAVKGLRQNAAYTEWVFVEGCSGNGA